MERREDSHEMAAMQAGGAEQGTCKPRQEGAPSAPHASRAALPACPAHTPAQGLHMKLLVRPHRLSLASCTSRWLLQAAWQGGAME